MFSLFLSYNLQLSYRKTLFRNKCDSDYECHNWVCSWLPISLTLMMLFLPQVLQNGSSLLGVMPPPVLETFTMFMAFNLKLILCKSDVISFHYFYVMMGNIDFKDLGVIIFLHESGGGKIFTCRTCTKYLSENTKISMLPPPVGHPLSLLTRSTWWRVYLFCIDYQLQYNWLFKGKPISRFFLRNSDI